MRDVRAEKPTHPADPRREPREGTARPQGPDRASERASENAAWNRKLAREAQDASAQPAKDQPPAENTAKTDAMAGETSADAALIIEAALAEDTDPSADAKATADKNDSALVTALGLGTGTECLAAPVPVTALADPTAQTEPTAPAGTGIVTDAKQSAVAVTGGGLGGEAALPAEDTHLPHMPKGAPDGTVPGADLTVKGEKAQAGDAGEPRTRAFGDQAPSFGEFLSAKPQAHFAAAGLQAHLQPAATELSAPAAPPANPALPAAPQTPPVPVQAVPITIGLKALEGAREFEIRLDPAELGRVDVKLSISEDGRVQASLVVDRVETLALLQRDARTLERAFDQAGLTADANAIQFSLRQDGGGDQSRRERFDDGGAAGAASPLSDLPPAQERPAQLYRGFVRETAVDIRV